MSHRAQKIVPGHYVYRGFRISDLGDGWTVAPHRDGKDLSSGPASGSTLKVAMGNVDAYLDDGKVGWYTAPNGSYLLFPKGDE